MSITFQCDCGKRFKVEDNYAGKRVRCQSCNAIVMVPQPEAAQSAPAQDPLAALAAHASSPAPSTPRPKPASAPAPKGAAKPGGRSDVKIVGWCCAFIGLLMGALLGILAYTNFDLYNATRVAPKTMRVADLIRSGPGDNRYLTLTDFTIGPGYACETSKNDSNHWSIAYLAIFPSGGNANQRDIQVVFKTSFIHSEQELEAFGHRGSIVGVSSASPTGSWGTKLGTALRDGNHATLNSAYCVTAVDTPPSITLIYSLAAGSGVLLLVGVIGAVVAMVKK